MEVSFEPFTTVLNPAFWHKLTQLKLNVFQLDESPVAISGLYGLDSNKGIPPEFRIDYTAFDGVPKAQNFSFASTGKLLNTNTLEKFQSLCTRNTLLSICREVFNDIESGSALSKPVLLNKFLFLCHGDLKRFNFHYWLAYAALIPHDPFLYVEKPKALTMSWDKQNITSFEAGLRSEGFTFSSCPFFGYDFAAREFLSLQELHSREKLETVAFCFADASSNENFSWPLRNFLLLIRRHFNFPNGYAKFIALRRTKDSAHNFTFAESLIFTVQMRKIDKLSLDKCSIVGWERHRKSGKLQPSYVDMSRSMDPAKLASEAVTLNLKLMKWRVAPELNLEKISSASCLLLGCGTLGCNVARCLLSWGVHNMALVDNGKISYSNPVRQSLFTFKHCTDGMMMKADAAAESLKLIYPGVSLSTYPQLTIPMPGHPISPAVLEDSRKNWEQLDKLVRECDVLFLLTDSRESRWLPSVMAAAYGKLAITSALGFDSFVVMRHGCRKEDGDTKLGCYFCTDIVGPTNSLRERTLDQQCTVSRGGISMLASGLAVELMVSVMNHPFGPAAPADAADNCLGVVPHQIRGFLSKFEQITISSPAFDNCSACSPAVVDAYKEGGFEFVAKVCSSPNFLEEISGLAELQRESAKLSLEDFCTGDDDDF